MGVHDFPEDLELPSSSEIVDPAEVEVDEVGDALGEKIPTRDRGDVDPIALRHVGKRRKKS